MKNSKIIITGTGRCGTTYIMKLLTLLNLDTGYNPNTMYNFIYKNCNSGLEIDINNPNITIPQIIKSPKYSLIIPQLYERFNIEYVIVPIRDLKDTTISRSKFLHNNGGYPNNINTFEEMLEENKIRFIKLISDLVSLNINYILIDFNKMISDSSYLYNKLKPILNNINYLDFHENFIKASK